MNSLRLPFYVKLAFVLFILLALGYIAILGERIFTPLLFSFLFAILLQPFASFLERQARLQRVASSSISVVAFLARLFLVLYILGTQLASLSQDWPILKSQLTLLFYNTQLWAITHLHIDAQRQLAYIHNATDNLLQSGTTIVGRTVLSLSSMLLFL